MIPKTWPRQNGHSPRPSESHKLRAQASQTTPCPHGSNAWPWQERHSRSPHIVQMLEHATSSEGAGMRLTATSRCHVAEERDMVRITRYSKGRACCMQDTGALAKEKNSATCVSNEPLLKQGSSLVRGQHALWSTCVARDQKLESSGLCTAHAGLSAGRRQAVQRTPPRTSSADKRKRPRCRRNSGEPPPRVQHVHVLPGEAPTQISHLVARRPGTCTRQTSTLAPTDQTSQ